MTPYPGTVNRLLRIRNPAGTPVLACRRVRTRYGRFLLQATPKGLYALKFPARARTIPCRQSPESVPGKSVQRLLEKAESLLARYFKGENVSFGNLRIDYSGLSAYSRKVLMALSRIPQAHTVSYGRLAKWAGQERSARAVGQVMARNRMPIILPCHRVLGSRNRLGGFSVGLKWKKRLLALEGVRIKD